MVNTIRGRLLEQIMVTLIIGLLLNFSVFFLNSNNAYMDEKNKGELTNMSSNIESEVNSLENTSSGLSDLLSVTNPAIVNIATKEQKSSTTQIGNLIANFFTSYQKLFTNVFGEFGGSIAIIIQVIDGMVLVLLAWKFVLGKE
ncbi:MAG: hypothetical protein IMZ60_02525 [Actinobacteria bacterium]|nr:hypothetical protein [Actinomycetota bacterium]